MCEWSPDPINANKTLLLFSSPLAWVNTVRWIFLILLAHSPTLELLCCGSNATRTHTHPLYTHTHTTQTHALYTRTHAHTHWHSKKAYRKRHNTKQRHARAYWHTTRHTHWHTEQMTLTRQVQKPQERNKHLPLTVWTTSYLEHRARVQRKRAVQMSIPVIRIVNAKPAQRGKRRRLD